ncbi:MAG: hypothetical protein KBT39_01470 [Bacteroidales bacterium]|nr:hypothetical protein [Bacteroidales bacterium]
MNKLDKQLLLTYILTLVVAIGCYLYFEFSGQKVVSVASKPGISDAKYMTEVVTDLLAILFVYLSTRLMRMPKVLRSIAANNAKYAQWAYLRWAMLAFIIFLGEGVHYFYNSPSTVGCPIIGCLAMFFVWPTSVRREGEIKAANEFGLHE